MADITGGFWSNLISWAKSIYDKTPTIVKDVVKQTIAPVSNIIDKGIDLGNKFLGEEEKKDKQPLPLGNDPDISNYQLKLQAQGEPDAPETIIAKKQLEWYESKASPFLAGIFGKQRAGRADATTDTILTEWLSLIGWSIADLYNKVDDAFIDKKGSTEVKARVPQKRNAFTAVQNALDEKVESDEMNAVEKMLTPKIKEYEDMQKAETAYFSLLEKRKQYEAAGDIYNPEYTNIIEALKDPKNLAVGKSEEILRNEINTILKSRDDVVKKNQINSSIRANFSDKKIGEQAAKTLGNVAIVWDDALQKSMSLQSMNVYTSQKKDSYDRLVASWLLTQQQADQALLNDINTEGISYVQKVNDVLKKGKAIYMNPDGTPDADKLRELLTSDRSLVEFWEKLRKDRLTNILASNDKKIDNSSNRLGGALNTATAWYENLIEFATPGLSDVSWGLIGNNTVERVVDDLSDPYDNDINLAWFNVSRSNRIAAGREILRGLVEDPSIFISLPRAWGLALRAEGIVGKTAQLLWKGSGAKIFRFLPQIEDGVETLSKIDNAIDIEQRISRLWTKKLSSILGIPEAATERVMRWLISSTNEMVWWVPLNILIASKTDKWSDSQWSQNFGFDAAAWFIFPWVKKLSDLEGMVYDIRKTGKGTDDRAKLIRSKFPFIDKDIAKEMWESDVNNVVTELSNYAQSQPGKSFELWVNWLKNYLTDGDINYKSLDDYISALKWWDLKNVPEHAQEIFQRAKEVLNPIETQVKQLSTMQKGTAEYNQLDSEVKTAIWSIVDWYNKVFVQQIVSDRTAQALASNTVEAMATGIMKMAEKEKIPLDIQDARALAVWALNGNTTKIKVMERMWFDWESLRDVTEQAKLLNDWLETQGASIVNKIINSMDLVDDWSSLEMKASELKETKIPESDKENLSEIANTINNSDPEQIENVKEFSSSIGDVSRSLGDSIDNVDIKMLSAAWAIKKSYNIIEFAILTWSKVTVDQYRKLYSSMSKNITEIVDTFVEAKMSVLKNPWFTKEELKQAFYSILSKTKMDRQAMNYSAISPENAVNSLVDFVQSTVAISKNGNVSEQEAAFLADTFVQYSEKQLKGNSKEANKLKMVIKDTKSQIPDYANNTYSQLNPIDITRWTVKPDSIPEKIMMGTITDSIPPLKVLLDNVMNGTNKAIQILSNNPIYYTDDARKYLSTMIAEYWDDAQIKQFQDIYNESYKKLSDKNLWIAQEFWIKFYDGETWWLLLNDETWNSFLQVLSSLGDMFTTNGVFAPPTLQLFKYLEDVPENEGMLSKLFNSITDTPETDQFLEKMWYSTYFDFYKWLKERAIYLMEENWVDNAKQALDILDPMLFNPQRNIDIFIKNIEQLESIANNTIGWDLMNAFIWLLSKQRVSSWSGDFSFTQVDNFIDSIKKLSLDWDYYGSYAQDKIIFDTMDKVYKFFSEPSNYGDVVARNSAGQPVLLFVTELDQIWAKAWGFNEYMYKVLYRDVLKSTAGVSNSFAGNILTALGRSMKEAMYEDISKIEGGFEILENWIQKLSDLAHNDNLSTWSKRSFDIDLAAEVNKFITEFKKFIGIDTVENERFNGFIEAIQDYSMKIEEGQRYSTESSVLRKYMIDYSTQSQELISKSYLENRWYDSPEQVVSRMKSYADMQKDLNLNKIQSMGIGINTDYNKLIRDIAYEYKQEVRSMDANELKKIDKGFDSRINKLIDRLNDTKTMAKEVDAEINLTEIEQDLAKLKENKVLTSTQKNALTFLDKIARGFDMNAYTRTPEYNSVIKYAQWILDNEVMKNKSWKEYYLLDRNAVLQLYSKEQVKKVDNFLIVAALGQRNPEISRMFWEIQENSKKLVSKTAAFGDETMSMKKYAGLSSDNYYEVTKDMNMGEIRNSWNAFKLSSVKVPSLTEKELELYNYFQKTFTDIDRFRKNQWLGAIKDLNAVVDGKSILDYLWERFASDIGKKAFPWDLPNTFFGNWLYLDYNTINRLSKQYSPGLTNFKVNQLLWWLTTKWYAAEGETFFSSPLVNAKRKWNSEDFQNIIVDAIINPINRVGASLRFNMLTASNQFIQQYISNTVEAVSKLKSIAIDWQVTEEILDMVKQYVWFDIYDMRWWDDIVQNIVDGEEIIKPISIQQRAYKKLWEIISNPKFIAPYLADHATKDTVMQSAVASALYKYSEAWLGINWVIGFQNQIWEMEKFVGTMNELYKNAGGKFESRTFWLQNFWQYTPKQFIIDNMGKVEGVTPQTLRDYKQYEKFYKGEFTDFIGSIRTNAAATYVQDKTAELASIPFLTNFTPLGNKTFFAMQKWGIGKSAEYFRGIQEAYYKIGATGIAKQLLLAEMNEINKPIFDLARQVILISKLSFNINKTTQDWSSYSDTIAYLVPFFAWFALSPIGSMGKAAMERYDIDRATGENRISSLFDATIAWLISPTGRILPYMNQLADAIWWAYATGQEFDDTDLTRFMVNVLNGFILDQLFGLNKLTSSKSDVLADPTNAMSNFLSSQLGTRSQSNQRLQKQNSIFYEMSSKVASEGKLQTRENIKRVLMNGLWLTKFTAQNSNEEYIKSYLNEYFETSGLQKLTQGIEYDDPILQKIMWTVNGNWLAEIIPDTKAKWFSTEDGMNALYTEGKIDTMSPFNMIIKSVLLTTSKSSNLINVSWGEEETAAMNTSLQALTDQYRWKKNTVLVEKDLTNWLQAYIRKGGVMAVGNYMDAYMKWSKELYKEAMKKKYGISEYQRKTDIANSAKNTVTPQYLKEYKVNLDKSQDQLNRIVRPVVKNEREVMQAIQLQYMKYDPEFHLTGIKEVVDTSPKWAAAFILDEKRINDTNIDNGIGFVNIGMMGNKAQLTLMDKLWSVKLEDLDDPEVQKNTTKAFELLNWSLDSLKKNVPDERKRFVMQSSLAQVIAQKIDGLAKKYGSETKAYLDKLDNTGKLWGAIEYAVSSITDSIPMSIESTFEMVTGLNTNWGGGKWSKLWKQNFGGPWNSFENYLKPLNKISKIAAENFNKPNQYEYSVVKTWTTWKLKATPISQGKGEWSLTRRNYWGNISTWKLTTPDLPVKVGRVLTAKRKPNAIWGAKVYSRKIGWK